ncbi:MAG: hypothetical protein A2Z48_04115 [Actinobacteria bacterium RBG_19FT_COMBO_70_19]|nr:MAG: hypothetical protein A2Z48_04115 [Actinobacteria bacterium RBG_19FT_COMBO_70_19]
MPDARFDLELYALPEAARLTRVPRQTLVNWVRGYPYRAGGRTVRAKPAIQTVGRSDSFSFVNLIEARVLSGFRRVGVPMQRVRKALDYAERQATDIEHLLASERLLTDGQDLFWEFQERAGGERDLVNLSKGGQKAFPEAVMRFLREMEWGRDRFAERWWPGSAPREGLVVVDPEFAFGAPTVRGTGIRTEDVFSRFSAGEPLADLSDDYGLTLEQVETAIRFEVQLLEPERIAA